MQSLFAVTISGSNSRDLGYAAVMRHGLAEISQIGLARESNQVAGQQVNCQCTLKSNLMPRAIVLLNPHICGDYEMQSLESEIVKENFQLECLELCHNKYRHPQEEFLHSLDCNHGGRKILHDRNFP